MGKSTPKPPDPKETSAAQTGTSVSTAIANAHLGNISEYGPDGSTQVKKTGMESMYDPYTGKTYEIPTFSRYTELSDAQKAIKGQHDGASLNLATLGNQLSGTLGQQLTGNFKLGNEETESRLMELGSKRLDPRFAQEEEALRTRLINSGVREGTAAYDAAFSNFSQGKNDAYNSLLLSGRGQASQELLTEDNQRINQISALLNGGQVSQPNFMGANMPTIPTTDNAGIIQADYQNRMAAAQQKNSTINSIMGGMFDLGSSFIMASDERLKEDIKKVGKTDDGQNLYSYRYKAGGPMQIGLMAQEVEKKKPGAVVTMPSGYKAVDYGKALGLMGSK